MANSKPPCPNGHPDESVTSVQELPHWHCLACLGEGRPHDLGPVNSPRSTTIDQIDEERRRIFLDARATRKKKRKFREEG